MAISALILCVALYLVGRHEAEISLPIISMITAGVSVTAAILLFAIGPFALLIALVLLAILIHRFCYLSWPKSLTVTAIYADANIAVSVIPHLIEKE